ncbi:MAG: radical SAM protein [Clostridia bacterium]|nr:radical SAM protein [Clostridia bacterium]
MAKAKERILPFFIPHIGCPHRCVFCDQVQVAGTVNPPTSQEIEKAINSWRESDLPTVAVYGGSFTALPKAEQVYFLKPAYDAMKQNKIKAIRLSTRPDAVDKDSLSLLKEYGVSTVEIGVQSMEPKVLQMAERGHTPEDSLKALALLKQEGFISGVQLMPGLPGETFTGAIEGAKKILSLKPNLARIYPTLVIKNTKLARLYEQELYIPLTLEEATAISAQLVLLCDHYGVNVIRVGLQPTADIYWGASVMAGPFHPAFGHLVKSRIFRQKLEYLLKQTDYRVVYVSKANIPAVVGQNRSNLPFYGAIKIRGWSFSDDTVALGDANEPKVFLEHKRFIEIMC